ncbi:MAG: amino acid ABC transporter permease [Actinobacteria bacterium]|nr:amino acid ABC transporter permease [Actinomycetota bacterium]
MDERMPESQQEPTVEEAQARLDKQTGAKEQPIIPELLPLPAGGLKAWVKKNLFGSVKDAILTVVFGALLGYLAYRTFGYVFLNQKVMPDGTVRSGWEVVFDGPLVAYMLGNRFNQTGLTYANVWGAIYLLTLVAGLIAGVSRAHGNVTPLRTTLKILAAPIIGVAAVLVMTRTLTPTLLVLAGVVLFLVVRWAVPKLPERVLRRAGWISMAVVAVAFVVLTGGDPSNVDKFGGLLLTIVVSAGGIVLSFPLGVLLALARRSSFPLIRPIAVVYIELIRGVPLITLLFMGRFAFGFFLPVGWQTPGVITRAIVMITLFTAAYVAEVVRGGLQSVPRAQTEGAQALGLSPLKITRLIVLPQALRNSIPALIGQFISLLKDTSLLVVIGIPELLGITEQILAQLKFKAQGFQPETYAFVCLIYWVICFSMSRASQRLETRLGVGTR